jgi:hypothetical protein
MCDSKRRPLSRYQAYYCPKFGAIIVCRIPSRDDHELAVVSRKSKNLFFLPLTDAETTEIIMILGVPSRSSTRKWHYNRHLSSALKLLPSLCYFITVVGGQRPFYQRFLRHS